MNLILEASFERSAIDRKVDADEEPLSDARGRDIYMNEYAEWYVYVYVLVNATISVHPFFTDQGIFTASRYNDFYSTRVTAV